MTVFEQKFTILGCSSSPGVPRINGDWGACDPKNPKNRRRRASFLIEQINGDGEKTTLVIDTGPDFREQMLSAEITDINPLLSPASTQQWIDMETCSAFIGDEAPVVGISAEQALLKTFQEGGGRWRYHIGEVGTPTYFMGPSNRRTLVRCEGSGARDGKAAGGGVVELELTDVELEDVLRRGEGGRRGLAGVFVLPRSGHRRAAVRRVGRDVRRLDEAVLGAALLGRFIAQTLACF